MIVWNVFDSAGLYQLTCTSEEAAKNAVKMYGRGWSARAVDTDYGDKFVDTVLYIVAIKKNSTEIRTVIDREPKKFGFAEFKGYERIVPEIRDCGDGYEVSLLAYDGVDAINKALELIKGKEEHI